MNISSHESLRKVIRVEGESKDLVLARHMADVSLIQDNITDALDLALSSPSSENWKNYFKAAKIEPPTRPNPQQRWLVLLDRHIVPFFPKPI
jgi:hypothetical protein